MFLLGFCKVPFEQPEFTEPIKNHTVDIGKNITFSCHVKNLQSFKVKLTTFILLENVRKKMKKH